MVGGGMGLVYFMEYYFDRPWDVFREHFVPMDSKSLKFEDVDAV